MKQLNTQLMHPADQLTLIIGRIYRSGLTTTSGGNLSIMDDNGDMWITPAGIDKGSLRASDIVCVRADGTIEGRHKPSSEYPFHKAIYAIRPGMKSVIHAHPPGLVTFSIVHQIPDTSIIPQARNVCGPIGFAPYDVPGSKALGEKIAQEFLKNPEYKAVIMENHGVVLCGEDISDAYQRFETLELCARTILNAKILGEPKLLSEEQIHRHDEAIPTSYPHFMNVQHPSDERALRTQICRIVRRACDQGLMCSSYGTASVRWRGNDFLITPTNIQRWDIDEDDIVQVRGGAVEAGKVPSRSVALHQEIYQRNPKVNAIILTQSPSLMGYCTTFSQLKWLRGLMGISEALYIPSSLSLIADYHTGKSRSLAVGIHMTGLYLGQALGGFGANLASALTWQNTFRLFGIIGIAYALILCIGLREARPAVAESRKEAPKIETGSDSYAVI